MPLLGAGTVILVAALMVIGYLRGALLIYLQGRLDSEMMIGLFEHMLSLPFRFFQLRNTGDLLMRLASNDDDSRNADQSDRLRGAGRRVRSRLFRDSAVLASGFCAARPRPRIDAGGAVVRFHSTVRHLMERDLAAGAASQSYLAEALMGIATVKAAGAEDRVIEHWSNLFFTHLNISLERGHLSVIIDTAMLTLRTLSPLALLWMGAVYVLNGGMSLGTMLALNALAASVLVPLASLVSSGQQLQLVRAHLDRLADVADAEPEQDLKHVRAAPPFSGKVELRHVSFRYDAQAPQVLRDITVTIGAGQKVALVGRTGSGRARWPSSSSACIHPSEGEILYDGIPMQHLDYRTLRSSSGRSCRTSSCSAGRFGRTSH